MRGLYQVSDTFGNFRERHVTQLYKLCVESAGTGKAAGAEPTHPNANP